MAYYLLYGLIYCFSSCHTKPQLVLGCATNSQTDRFAYFNPYSIASCLIHDTSPWVRYSEILCIDRSNGENRKSAVVVQTIGQNQSRKILVFPSFPHYLASNTFQKDQIHCCMWMSYFFISFLLTTNTPFTKQVAFVGSMSRPGWRYMHIVFFDYEP